MAIEAIESTNTPNEGREIINDNFIDLDGRINEINPDGLAWHFGIGAPLDSVGFDGDMYFATNTGTYYGPKAAGVWPSSGVVVSAVPDATETDKGKAEIATQTETDAGADDTRIVTPLKLANYSGLGSGGGNNATWDPVRVATTVNITLSGAQLIDGVSVVAGDRVLVMNQTSNVNNGIYVCAAGAWTRATDANTSGEFLHGKMVFIGDEGTENGNQIGFFATTTSPFTLGTTPATFLLAIAGATETQWGTVRAATQSEVNAGTVSTDLVVTPEKLAAWTGGSATPAASETVAGKAEIATQTETNTGTDDVRIVTPLKLASRTSTDTRAGVVELATDTETQTGTDTARAITPASLSARSATETRTGIAEIATQTETDTGTDDVRIITALKAATRYLAKTGGTLTGFLTLHADPSSAMHAVTKQYADGLVTGGASPASETVAGIAELATQTETNTGTDDTRIVTPLKLANYSGLGGSLPAPITVYHWNDHTSVVLTNMSASLNVFYSGGNTFETPTDLTDATQARIFVKVVTAGHTTAEVRAQFATSFGGTYGYLDASAGPAVNISTTGGIKSSWVTLDAGVKADGFIRVITINGNAIADPVVAEILVQVR